MTGVGMFALSLLLAAPQAAPAPKPAETPDVVVVANRMGAALKRCLERNCPPEEEVEAAMEAGAESFVAGRYEEAKKTLRLAISRNAKYAKVIPTKISDLYATYADVAEHEGDETAFIDSTRNSVTVLRRALGEGHPAAIRVSARLGDMWAKLGQPQRADGAYQREAERAARFGRRDLAGMLTFRRAWLALAARDKPHARKLSVQLEREYGQEPVFTPALAILKARLALGDGKDDGTAAFIAAIRQAGMADPLLMREPPYPEFGPAPMVFGSSRDIVWADIGFWIQPDGTTAGVEILRPAEDGAWARRLFKQIAGRRYSPVEGAETGAMGVYRVERYTLRPAYKVDIGTRIRQRVGPVSLHQVDITKLAAHTEASATP